MRLLSTVLLAITGLTLAFAARLPLPAQAAEPHPPRVPSDLLSTAKPLDTRYLPRGLCHPGGDVFPLFTGALANQTTIVVPPERLNYLNLLLLGRGVQNWTCAPAQRWVNDGAVANLHDAGCMLQDWLVFNRSVFATALPRLAYDTMVWPSPYDMDEAVNHYFVPNPVHTSPAIVPHIQLGRILQVDKGVSMKPIAALPTPNWQVDVPWLDLEYLAGDKDLASVILRTDTVGGVLANQSCVPGDTAVVDYAALYWFYLPGL